MDLFVPVDGGQVWAQDTGGPGLPVVLMHPGWGDSTIWDPVIDRLTGPPRVIRYDTRGVGRSPAPAASFTQLGDLIAVLDYLDIPRAVLGAHSEGRPLAAAAGPDPAAQAQVRGADRLGYSFSIGA